MKKPSKIPLYIPKRLATSVAGLMMLSSLTPTALHASDTEIYQAGTEGKVTLMLQIDLSGSMDFTSIFDDFRAIRVEPNHATSLPDGLVTSQFENRRFRGDVASENHNYTQRWNYNQQKIETDTSPSGFVRQYFSVPITPANRTQINYNLNNERASKKGLSGCPIVKNTTHGYDEYRCYTRLSRMKEAFVEVLSQKDANGEYVLKGDRIIGLSAYSDGGDHMQGYILSPARPLDEKLPSGITQREDLIAKFKNMQATGGTPTGTAYAETIAYLMGTSVNDGASREYIARGTGRFVNSFVVCMRFNADGSCSAGTNWWSDWDTRPWPRHVADQSIFSHTPSRTFVSANNGGTYQVFRTQYEGGFRSSDPTSKDETTRTYIKPASLVEQEQKPNLRQCSGQGIYVLTDGEPNINYFSEIMTRAALRPKTGFTCRPDGSGWNCMHEAARALLDPAQNPAGLKFKTAVVGFGTSFNSVPSYNPSLTKQQNLDAVNSATHTDRNFGDVQNAARWGIIGEGGWYSGNSPDDVIKSINNFIAQLQQTVPTTVTGQPFIPIDPLNRLRYMNDAYYGAFNPMPGKNKTFWSGDINKYVVKNQQLYGKDGNALFNGGVMSSATQGFWSNATANGAKGLLPIKDNAGTVNRNVLTNLVSTPNTDLQKVTLKSLYPSGGAEYQAGLAGASNGYLNSWLNILGYNVATGTPSSPATPADESTLNAQPELRQLGALLHSTPIILTQQMTGSPINPTTREDYILYGSTQGILHVIDGKTGVEKIAFVPQEMMTNTESRNNFQHVDGASASIIKGDTLTYGVDGQWTAYTQYAPTTGGHTTNASTGATSLASDLSGKGVQWVYGGLRMGGRSYYALDLSDINSPKLKFHINPDGAAAGSPLSYMGQSWSKPTMGFVNWQGKRRLVMFVGGGYDEGYEKHDYEQANGKGAGVYMFDAHDGTLLWWASEHATTGSSGTNHSDLKYSVVSNIATLDVNNDGLVDNLYFGDLGGQVFRVDFDNNYNHSTAGESLISRVVRLYNAHETNGLSPRFYEAPSFSVHSGAGATGKFGVVSIASGNRSSPLTIHNKQRTNASGQVTTDKSANDALFVLYDHDTLKAGNHKKGATQTTTDGVLATLTAQDAKNYGGKALPNDFKTFAVINNVAKTGWKYPFGSTGGVLKGFSSPRVVDNLLFVNTYTPTKNQPAECSAGIVGESYQELFCMPSGICDAERHKMLGEGAIPNDADTGDAGSIYRFGIGDGLVQTAVGNADGDPTKGGVVSSVAPKIDCAKDPHNAVCIREVSNIGNKPVRWYEDQSK